MCRIGNKSYAAKAPNERAPRVFLSTFFAMFLHWRYAGYRQLNQMSTLSYHAGYRQLNQMIKTKTYHDPKWTKSTRLEMLKTDNRLQLLLIRIYMKLDKLAMVNELLSEMKTVDVDVYNTLLLKYSDLKMLSWSISVFDLMKSRGAVDSKSYHCMIRTCYISKRYDLAIAYYKEMIQEKHIPNDVLGLIMLNIYADTDLDSAEKLFNTLKLSLKTCNVMLKAYSRKGQTEKFGQLLDLMNEKDLKPDMIIYQTHIMFCFKNNQLDQAMKIIESLPFAPDSKLVNTVIAALVQAGESAKAYYFFRKQPQSLWTAPLIRSLIPATTQKELLDLFLRSKAIQLDIQTFNLFIRSFLQQYDIEMVEKCWLDIQKRKLKPNSITYGHYFDATLSSYNVEKCLNILTEMISKQVSPSDDQFARLIYAAVHSGNFHVASKTIYWLRKQSKSYSLKTLSEHQGNLENSIRILSETQEDQLSTNLYSELTKLNCILEQETYRAAIKSFLKQGNLIGCIKAWSLLIENHAPTEKSCEMILEAVHNLGHEQVSKALLKSFSKAKFKLNQNGHHLLLSMKLKYDQNPEISSILNMIDDGYTPNAETLQVLEKSIKSKIMYDKVYDFMMRYYPEVILQK
jgi:pentatricopeptide repeat protein